MIWSKPIRNPHFNKDKFRELVLYIAETTESDSSFGAIKMAKALWLSDFRAFRDLGEPITAATYQKIELGPAPRQYPPVIRELERDGEASVVAEKHYGNELKKVYAKRRAKREVFSTQELAIVDEVIAMLGNVTGRAVSNWSHEWIWWKSVEFNEEIPYGVVLFPAQPVQLTESDYDFGKRVAAKIDAGEYSCNTASR